jgi:hypothetical protein
LPQNSAKGTKYKRLQGNAREVGLHPTGEGELPSNSVTGLSLYAPFVPSCGFQVHGNVFPQEFQTCGL